ncbi:MAG TPA: site-specific integrase [Blastocatellia bacterium]|jgi:integrase|nr:site-specific integrase [Blastocatellia bacterium]
MGRPRQGSVYYNKARKTYIAQLDWTDDTGKRRQRKRQVENISAGNNLVKKWIREIDEHDVAYIDAERMTFKHLAEKYEATRLIEPQYRDGVKVAGLRSWEMQRWRLKHLIKIFGKRRIRSITYADIERYRNERLATPAKITKKQRGIADVQRGLSLLGAIFTFAVENEWLTGHPFKKGKPLISMAMEPPRERVFSTDEQRAILQNCQTTTRRHIYPIVLVALDSGCRRGELLNLKWADVDLDRGTLTVLAENAKTNRKRAIDLEPITVEQLRKMAKESGGFADQLVFGIKATFQRAWHVSLKDAKVENAHFHDLRATAITTWLLRGMSMPFAMARSGHADPRTFMRYVRMAEEIREKQREQLREWDLAASLAELAGGDVEIEPERSELVN